jgi:hypothetical protein
MSTADKPYGELIAPGPAARAEAGGRWGPGDYDVRGRTRRGCCVHLTVERDGHCWRTGTTNATAASTRTAVVKCQEASSTPVERNPTPDPLASQVAPSRRARRMPRRPPCSRRGDVPIDALIPHPLPLTDPSGRRAPARHDTGVAAGAALQRDGRPCGGSTAQRWPAFPRDPPKSESQRASLPPETRGTSLPTRRLGTAL